MVDLTDHEAVAVALFGLRTDFDVTPDTGPPFSTMKAGDDFEFDSNTGKWFDFNEDAEISEEALIMRVRRVTMQDALTWRRDLLANGANGHDEPPELPADLAEERALLGLLAHKPTLLAAAEEEIGANDFVSPLHGEFFLMLCNARDADVKIDAHDITKTLSQHHPKAFAGLTVPQYIAHLIVNAPVSPNDDETFARARELARGIRVFAEAERGDVEVILEEPKQEPHFKLTSFDAVKITKEPRYLVHRLIPRRGITLTWGPPKCGKSFWMFDVAMHVALGWPYRGRDVERGPVVYLVLEGEYDFQDRIEAFKQRFMREHKGPVPFYVIAATLDLINEHGRLIIDIKAQMAQTPPALVVIDTLNRSLKGSESSDQDMTAYVNGAAAIWKAFECAVVVVHHSGHEASRPRGHTALMGAVDAQLAVKRDPDRNVVVTVERAKGGPEGDSVVSRLQEVEIGQDSRGRTLKSLVVVPLTAVEEVDAHIGRIGFQISGHEVTFFECLIEALADKGVVPPPDLKVPARINRVVHYDEVKVLFRMRELHEEEDQRLGAQRIKTALSRARRSLTRHGVIEASAPYIWPTGKRVRAPGKKWSPWPPDHNAQHPVEPVLSDEDARGFF